MNEALGRFLLLISINGWSLGKVGRFLLLISIKWWTLENFRLRYPFNLAMTSLFTKQRMKETTSPWLEVDRAEMTAWTFSQAESGSGMTGSSRKWRPNTGASTSTARLDWRAAASLGASRLLCDLVSLLASEPLWRWTCWNVIDVFMILRTIPSSIKFSMIMARTGTQRKM